MKLGSEMRARLRNFLPVVLVALMVQIFAPIDAYWAASISSSDALNAVRDLPRRYGIQFGPKRSAWSASCP